MTARRVLALAAVGMALITYVIAVPLIPAAIVVLAVAVAFT